MSSTEGQLDRRLATLREVDPATHAVLQGMLPHLAERLERESEVAAVIDLMMQVAIECPESALVLAGRLPGLASSLSDTVGLRKWALYGLQRYRDDRARRLRYFTYDDTDVFSDRRTKDDAAHMLRERDSLLHYLAGFGLNDLWIELHEPTGATEPSPSVCVERDVIRFARRSAGIATWQRTSYYRACLAHVAGHLRHSKRSQPAGNRKPILLACIGLVEDARIEQLMMLEFPGLRGLWAPFHVASRETSGFEMTGLAARLTRALHDPSYVDTNTWVDGGRKLFVEAANTGLGRTYLFEAVGRKLAIGLEKMRLALPANYRATPNYRDDNALLWDFNETLKDDERTEVELKDVEFRPQAEVPPNPREVDIDRRRRLRYPEWDHRLLAVREDWATVVESVSHSAPRVSRTFAAKARIQTGGQSRTPDRAIRLSRLAEGDELDLDAVVSNAVDLRSRLIPDGRVFRRHGRRSRSSAVIVLMDLSESTGRFVPDSFTTVVDVEKSAARAVVSSLHGARDRVAVHGFASNGRHEINYYRFKNLDEDFGPEHEARLGSLQVGLSTRMGAALRHASNELATQDADHKVILMLTDGEPSDVDVLEDDYLVEDARHAVVGAAARGIQTFCLTLDRHADDYVRRIFGSRNYLIADRAANFAGYTGQALVRLIAH